jgi:hypothetical protein
MLYILVDIARSHDTFLCEENVNSFVTSLDIVYFAPAIQIDGWCRYWSIDFRWLKHIWRVS